MKTRGNAMFVFSEKSFNRHLRMMSSTLSNSTIIFLIAWSSIFNVLHRIEARDSSLLGYYLQLYNSINSYRAKHTIPALRWNRTLTESAEDYAMRILNVPKSTFDIEESEGLTIFVTPGTIRPAASFVTGSWYNESNFYNFNTPGYNPASLNFTQMIWKSSVAVGIGTHTNHNYTAVVAKFYPAGNIREKFRQNVIPQYKRI